MSNRDFIQHELDERARLETEARAILETAKAETREPTAEEEERWDKLIEESDRRKARIVKLEQMDKDTDLDAQVRARIGETATAGSGTPAQEKPKSQDRLIVDAFLDVQRQIFAIGSDEARAQAVEKTLGFNIDMAAVRKAESEVRAIADFSDSDSLYVSDFSTRVAVYMRTLSPWISQSTVINADNGRPIILPDLTADVTVYTPGEGTAVDESSPTLGTVTATPVSYKALTAVSQEAEEDEVVGLMGLISRSHARALGLAFGSAETTAVLAAATNGGTATGLGAGATATFFGLDDLYTSQVRSGSALPHERRVVVFRQHNAEGWQLRRPQWPVPLAAGASAGRP